MCSRCFGFLVLLVFRVFSFFPRDFLTGLGARLFRVFRAYEGCSGLVL